jgi:hypothetical protein
MSDLPPDPFDDPRIQEHPIARYAIEAARLTTAFANIDSMSGLVEALNKAERRDVELVAMFTITNIVRESIEEAARLNGETDEAAHERFLNWMLDPPTTEPFQG